MDGCTFKPQLYNQNSRVDSARENKAVKGYKEVIQRYRTAAEEKQKLKEKIDRASRGANYEEMRKKNIQPFKSNIKNHKAKDMPFIVIEATVMPGKVIKIPLYETDNAEEVATNFSKIYHLSQESQKALTRVIKEQFNLN
eukprot:TRINITY_DN4854_c0_g1_i1.p1 TRINITY_DN4854_c0_g1~~TRINITY_DN4854_c0_g1_i1.p1  ORF type:complete len:140 (-),score=29.77 TRINITY_DN4854_c0_g1_i1:60-479(-)